ncbi:hypothetical protein P3X46_004939 [Hevea brasiliensis]|uniref:Copper transport protein n=1 Tax=Hevea brasiliensis TaxID=3981 RepID=A0ABQ9N137_HEVBR|nr:copper transporter 6 [Hevea brasiliensis]KAJ9185286.1 hypothetical protein P3X46_004939 [Hevea brasiliensis]
MSNGHQDHGDAPMTTGSMSDGSMNMSSMDMVMHMSFYWGKDAIILFSGWPKDSLGMYILAFLFVFVLAVAVEVLSVSPKLKLGSNAIVGAISEASVYAVRMGLAYMVMLAVMSFNLGIFIAAVAGHAIGLFFVKARALANSNRRDVSSDAPFPKV